MQAHDPLVSVIIPAYNIVRYLGRCVESVVCQTMRDFELILIDDGSTDGTSELCDALCQRNEQGLAVRVVHQANAGPGAARNAGLDVARGEYVAFVDGDDVVHERYLETLLAVGERASADVVQATYVLLGESDRAAHDARRCRRPVPDSPDVRVCRAGDALLDMLYQRQGGCDSSPCKLFRRSLFVSGGRFPADYLVFEDVLAMADILTAHADATVAVTDVPVYFYFKQRGGTLVSHSRTSDDAFAVCDILARRAASAGDAQLARAVASRRLSVAFHTLGLSPEPAVERVCWQAIVRGRGACLADRRVRLKNKCGILLSLCGRRLTTAVLRWRMRL